MRFVSIFITFAIKLHIKLHTMAKESKCLNCIKVVLTERNQTNKWLPNISDMIQQPYRNGSLMQRNLQLKPL